MKVTVNAPVVLTFSMAATIVFLLLYYTGIGQSFFILPPSFQTSSFSWYISLFGYTLGHASWAHLLGNLSFILLLGPILEEKYGSRKIIVMIFITAFCTAVFHMLFFSHALLGASGIVFMMIILVSLTNVRSGEIPLSFILIAIIFLGKEILAVFEQDQISQFAHIIGGIMGGIFGFGLAKSQNGGQNTRSDGDRLKDQLKL